MIWVLALESGWGYPWNTSLFMGNYTWKPRITLGGGASVARRQIIFTGLHQLATSYSESTVEACEEVLRVLLMRICQATNHSQGFNVLTVNLEYGRFYQLTFSWCSRAPIPASNQIIFKLAFNVSVRSHSGTVDIESRKMLCDWQASISEACFRSARGNFSKQNSLCLHKR